MARRCARAVFRSTRSLAARDRGMPRGTRASDGRRDLSEIRLALYLGRVSLGLRFFLERWLSGLKHIFAKDANRKVPRVRISPSPPILNPRSLSAGFLF